MGFTRIASAALLAVGFSLPASGSITISTDPTQFMKCKKGTCTQTADDAVLNVSDLETMLATSNVTVSTNKKAKDRKKTIEDIDLIAPLSWGSGKVLSLDATNSILIAQPVSVSNSGGLDLKTNAGTKGTLTIAPSANVTFSSTGSSLTINGAAYVLESTLPHLVTDVNATPSGRFALIKSYDASADGVYAHSPMSSILGTFEGLGNTLSNVSISSKDDNVGLFAEIQGTVRDLHLLNSSVSGIKNNGQQIGALAGLALGYVVSVTASGAVSATGAACIGGLVGHFEFAGLRTSGIEQSSASVAVSGLGELGGLLGVGDAGSLVSLSYATGDVTGGDGALAGGLVGLQYGTVDQAFATGTVSTGAGGTAGGLFGEINSNLNTQDVYATGAVSGGENSRIGGTVGYEFGARIDQAYSTGAVSGGSNSEVGGFLGEDQSGFGADTASYWDITTSGTDQGAGNQTNDPNVTGLTDKQLKARLPKGFKKNVWGQSTDINNGLPYLLALPPQ